VSKTAKGYTVSNQTSGWVISSYFDPSGTTSTLSGAIPEWAALSGLYDQYKVLSVTVSVTATVLTGAFNDTQVYGRFQYDPSYSPSLVNMQALRGVKVHTFSTEHPTCSWKVYPRVQTLMYSSGIVTTNTAYGPKKMPWADIDKPPQLWGITFASPYISSSVTLNFEVTYEMMFRYSV